MAERKPEMASESLVPLGPRKYRVPRKANDWKTLLKVIGDQLSPDERELVRLLAEGNSQASTAARLGRHRSAVWRKAKQIAMKAAGKV